jgi:hypothetical protein
MTKENQSCEEVLQKMLDTISLQTAGDEGDLDGMRAFILHDLNDRQLECVSDFIRSFMWRRFGAK